MLDDQLMGAHLEAFSALRFARVRRGQRGSAKIINTKTLIVLGSRSGAAH